MHHSKDDPGHISRAEFKIVQTKAVHNEVRVTVSIYVNKCMRRGRTELRYAKGFPLLLTNQHIHLWIPGLEMIIKLQQH